VTAPFRRMAVIGLGLLGGSVAAAARERGVAEFVVGSARRPEPLARALDRGLIDEILPVAEAVRGADLIVLATPVGAMANVLRDAAPSIESGALVTDVGSVKAQLVETLPGLLPAGVHFIGSHPMAGSHEKGVDQARPDLFDGACCVVTPDTSVDPSLLDRLVAFWQGLGAHVVLRDASVHDLEVAWVSHLPHALAFAYARALEHAPPTAGEVAGSGFHDFVRIARSDSELWAEILGMNRKSLAQPLRAFGDALRELAAAVESDDKAAQERLLESAGAQLRSLGHGASGCTVRTTPLATEERDGQTLPTEDDFNARSGGENPEIQAAPRAAATRSVNRNS
jgi:cyclohexadieny/prephenate dehydrogenase